MRISLVLLVAGSLCVAGVLAAGQGAATTVGTAQSSSASCERLAALQLPKVSISTAQVVAAGTFAGQPENASDAELTALYKKLPEFCRVVAHDKPTTDSDIVIEVWMPLVGWNGRFQGVGNGGFAGQVGYSEMAEAVDKGYATAGTDTGHTGSSIDADWALAHPEKVVDFGYRGIHEMTRLAKLMVGQFYGNAARRSYFSSCSDGGREALMEVQRYPADYDGILAGAPANYWTALLSTGVVDTQALTDNPSSYIPEAKLPAIARAVLAACDQLDGVSDGILNDPRQCHFDPATIECQNGGDADTCLTSAQVTALKKIYAGARDPDGQQVFPGYLPGAETGSNGWGPWITGPAPAKSLMAFFGIRYYSNMVYENADWDYKTFDLKSGLQLANEKTAAALNAVNPDLSAFRARGGKLILYHGWNDPAISALNTINYYESMEARLGRANAATFSRLYMVPGMQHCAGGPGPDSFGQSIGWTADDPAHNIRLALEDWVEMGVAPTSIIATKTAEHNGQGPAIMTRPLCPYPQSAKYKGSGDPDRTDNFVCTNPQ